MALSPLSEAASSSQNSISSLSSSTTTSGSQISELISSFSFNGSTTVTSSSSIIDSYSVSDNVFPKDTPIISFGLVPFNDRSVEIRNARLANALDSLDEGLPQGVDDTIKDLLKSHAHSHSTSYGHMAFLIDENYLEYKNNLVAKRVSEKKLPKSKCRPSYPK